MKEFSDRYNALPDEHRNILWGLSIEHEIRFMELEKKRLLADFRKATKAINDRIKVMKSNLERGL